MGRYDWVDGAFFRPRVVNTSCSQLTPSLRDGSLGTLFQPRKLSGLATFIQSLRDKDTPDTYPQIRLHIALPIEHKEEQESEFIVWAAPKESLGAARFVLNRKGPD